MLLHKNKIKGISFSHRSRQDKRTTKTPLRDVYDFTALREHIAYDTPQPLQNSDIRRLLEEHGRNEINMLASRCVDAITKWRNIIKTVEGKFRATGSTLYADFLGRDAEPAFLLEEVTLYLDAKKILFLWQHNLTLLEMIVGGQKSLTIKRRS